MRRSSLLIALALLLNFSAWFLPVVTVLDKLGPTLQGFQAFAVALSAVQPGNFDTGYEAALAFLSALTSLLFVLGTPWVIWRGTQAVRRFSAWAATVAFVFNAHWNGWKLGLGIGYSFWWSSFALLAVGLFDFTRRKHATEPTPTNIAPLPG